LEKRQEEIPTPIEKEKPYIQNKSIKIKSFLFQEENISEKEMC